MAIEAISQKERESKKDILKKIQEKIEKTLVAEEETEADRNRLNY